MAEVHHSFLEDCCNPEEDCYKLEEDQSKVLAADKDNQDYSK